MDYIFNGKINYDDYCQYLKILGGKIFTIKSIISWFFIGSIFIYSIIFIKNNDISKIIRNIDFIIVSIIGGIILIIIFITQIISLINNIKFNKFNEINKRKSFNINKNISKEYNYKINENNIIIDSKGKSLKLNTKSIYKIMFDEDSIYIFHGKHKVYIIKKRFLNNDNKYNELILFIKEYYKENII